MYLNLGTSLLVKKSDIIGIFDLDSLDVGGYAMEYLRMCEKNGEVVNVGDGIPKAFVVTSRDGKNKVYITTISSASLKGRCEAFK